ncbi:MAG: PIN domain-containing protein [Bifidobacteriaceae bacterium]|jgi:PIN domain nuclease of toxin-antitoxin system|nr:PIN domain-containing protein [Bifidobacteriaceae bacterium]
MPAVLDSSAALAFLWGEPGADAVLAAFADDAPVRCTVANWAEVAAKVFAKGGDWDAAEAALLGRGLEITPLQASDAVAAARIWLAHPQLSLGDRLCLAAAARWGGAVLTADRAWIAVSPEVRLIRGPAEPEDSGGPAPAEPPI